MSAREISQARDTFYNMMEREGLSKQCARFVYCQAAKWHRFAVEACNRPLQPHEEQLWELAQQRIKIMCEAHNIKPVFEALDVRLKVPSGLDDGWGGVFVPRTREG